MPTSLPTVNTIPLKQPSYTSMIISSMQSDHNNYHVCVSSISLLLLTPSTTASYSPVCHLGSASMALSSTGLSRTCHPAPSVSDAITLSHPSILAPRLHSWSSAFHHVHYPHQHSHLLPFPQPSPLCRRHPTAFLILPAHHNIDSSITHLQNALQQISTWNTANLLTLNSSKTEFLLIGLKNQLDKIHNSSLNTTLCTQSRLHL